jgi:hypothetical protein
VFKHIIVKKKKNFRTWGGLGFKEQDSGYLVLEAIANY